MEKKRRSPEEILEDIESAPIDDAAEQVLAMTAEERRRELAQAGVGERDIEAGVDAVLARMQRGDAGPQALRATVKDKTTYRPQKEKP